MRRACVLMNFLAMPQGPTTSGPLGSLGSLLTPLPPFDERCHEEKKGAQPSMKETLPNRPLPFGERPIPARAGIFMYGHSWLLSSLSLSLLLLLLVLESIQSC